MPTQDGDAGVWRKSTASETANCVEVSMRATEVWVRNTRDRKGGTLRFTSGEWDAFLTGVRQGEFDLPAPTADGLPSAG